jgi:hypothetical protein
VLAWRSAQRWISEQSKKMQAQNIPDELKNHKQWVTWNAVKIDKAVRKIPGNPHTNRHASSTDSSTWGSFEQAYAAMQRYGCNGLGFVLSEADPFCFIDLDHCDDPEILQKHKYFANSIDTYSEVSPSGKGLHIICKGSVPRGIKKDKVEIYSNARFMTMTGNVYKNMPIQNCQTQIDYIFQSLNQNKEKKVLFAINEEQAETDDRILEIASNAKNAEKFLELWNGDYSAYVTPTKTGLSEADFALVDIISFYTKNRDQIKRLFRASELGKREKYKREYHIERMIDLSFDRHVPILDFELLEYRKYEEEIAEIEEKATVYSNELTIIEEFENDELSKEDFEKNAKDVTEIYTLPEGIVGRLAQHIFSNSPKPIHQIAIASAIGLLAGLCGRSYNINGAGLNQYIVVVAGPGRGKEIIASSIQTILETVGNYVPTAKNSIGPNFGSAQGLISHLSKNSNCFVSIMGEFGKTYAQIMKGKDTEVGIQRVLLDLYNKSGNNNYLSATAYSKADNNLKGVKSPNVTIVGETSQEAFFSAMDESSLLDGWLSRFILIEYLGPIRKVSVSGDMANMPTDLLEDLCKLAANCDFLNKAERVIDVQTDVHGAKLLDDFENYVIKKANATASEATSNVWVRAHFKALKLAALIAVGRDAYTPTISYNDALWSTKLIFSECSNLLEKFVDGKRISLSYENQESARVSKLKEVINKYLEEGCSASYKINQKILDARQHRIVPKKFIMMCTSGMKIFRSHKLGATKALLETIEILKTVEFMSVVSSRQTELRFGTQSEAYYIN